MTEAHRVADLALVERPDQFATDPQQLAVFQQRRHQRGARGPHRQLRERVHAPHDFRDFLVGHDDPRAQCRQADLGQAHREDGVLVPLGALIDVNHSREGESIGVVHDQGDLPFPRYLIQPREFRLPNHVAGGIGGS